MSVDTPSTAPDVVGMSNGEQTAATNGNSVMTDPGSEVMAAASQAQADNISADEIALYDRQIRLWGVQAQERIRSAKILLVSVKALGTEIAKNLILNGINSITIMDDGIVTDDDFGAQYFLREEDLGKNRAESAAPRLQELNPRVSVQTDASDIRGKGPDFYVPFDMVIACDSDFSTLGQINAACRISNKPFYATGMHGFYGFIFADLISHEYIVEREMSNVTTVPGKAEAATRIVVEVTNKKENGKNIEMVKKREIYSPLLLANTSPLPQEYLRSRRRLKLVTPLLPCSRASWDFERNYGHMPSHTHEDLKKFTELATEKVKELQMPIDSLRADFLRSFSQNIGSELVPTAAFVGGRLSEDAINVSGKREQPIQNSALFDGESFDGPIYALHPIFPEEHMPSPTFGAPAAPQTLQEPLPMANFINGNGIPQNQGVFKIA